MSALLLLAACGSGSEPGTDVDADAPSLSVTTAPTLPSTTEGWPACDLSDYASYGLEEGADRGWRLSRHEYGGGCWVREEDE